MSISLREIQSTLDEILQPGRYQDYCPNGLQVEGGEDVSLLVTGVTACQALIDEAISIGAEAILVHHGFFWRDEAPVITGMKRQILSNRDVRNNPP